MPSTNHHDLKPMMIDTGTAEMLTFHRFLLGETDSRLDLFRRAIAERVKPGDAVLDLGAGTGILAIFACVAGARRVYAVEINPIIELAKQLVQDNGFADRIVFMNSLSYDVALAERVDVLVTDMSDTCGVQAGGLQSIIDARSRLVKAEGTMIPDRYELFAAPVDVAQPYEHVIEFWNQKPHGLDFAAFRRLATQNHYPARIEQGAFLSEPARFARLELSGAIDPAFHGDVLTTVQRRGVLHGICVWFSARLAENVVISNRPSASTTNYAQAFFPVERPVVVEEGDSVAIDFRSYDSVHWRWQVEVRRPDSASALKARFDQSTFWGFPLSRLRLRELVDASRLAVQGP
jgi:SAM-dependent methyltransferase